MPRSRNEIIACAVATLAAIFITTSAAAQSIPPAAEAFARKLEASCASVYRGSPKSPLAKTRSVDWLKILADDAQGKVLIAQGEKTRCEPVSQLICGTGGCPISVFQMGKRGAKIWRNEQVLSWKLVTDLRQPALRLNVHGSHCGTYGAQACVTILNLHTGKQRTFKPRA